MLIRVEHENFYKLGDFTKFKPSRNNDFTDPSKAMLLL